MTQSTRLGFSVSFLHDSLHHYHHMEPEAEVQLRRQYFQALVGSKKADFAALLRTATFNAPVVASSDGHVGGHQAHELAMTAVHAYNALGTGMSLGDPDEAPHCVQYYVIDGVQHVVYNYLLPVEQCGASCPPPGGTYHVVVSSTLDPVDLSAPA